MDPEAFARWRATHRYCVFLNRNTGLYAASLTPQDDAVALDCTLLEALRLCETLNTGLDGAQRVLAIASHEARRAA